jgi:urea transporter
MSLAKSINYSFYNTLKAVLNSYSILFFSNNKVLAIILLTVSFFNPIAGLMGLLSVLTAIFICNSIGYDKEQIQSGLFSFNALLVGIGIGTFYQVNFAFWLILLVACLFSVLFSIILSGWLGKYSLPFLSIPFVFTFWIVLLCVNEFSNLGLNQKNISWLSQMYVSNDFSFFKVIRDIDNWPFPPIVAVFFKSFSAIFFQNSLLAGILMSIGLLYHSRIAFTLLIIGFLTAYGFNYLVGGSANSINYYNMGANFMMSSVAIGGFFLIPSIRSYSWAIWSIPMTYLLVIALTKFYSLWALPIFSLPFCIVVIALLYFFKLRIFPGKLQLTSIQHYVPELNLYQFINNKERLQNINYFRLALPFIGEWSVWQGYDGNITHKGEWSKALDFVLVDEDNKTFGNDGSKPTDFYCFNKPVLASAAGYIEEVLNNIEDNEIGTVNIEQNWGNSIVIRHATGLYTKLSHLKKDSIKVKVGDFVPQGEIIAYCGNSGRSPQPHLHFQVQSTPFIGSKTLAYPFAYYFQRLTRNTLKLQSYTVPEKDTLVSTVEIDDQLKQAFKFQPGFKTCFQNNETGVVEHWEVFTDAYNQLYLYSEETKSTAWFINNGTVFYFTSFFGNKKSLLYCFYLAAYKITQINLPSNVSNDVYPLQLSNKKIALYFQDFVAPFFLFTKLKYHSYLQEDAENIHFREIKSFQHQEFFGRSKEIMNASIQVKNQKITSFNIVIKGKEISATWLLENLY